MARNTHCRTDMLTDSAERALHLLRNGTYTVGTHDVQLAVVDVRYSCRPSA